MRLAMCVGSFDRGASLEARMAGRIATAYHAVASLGRPPSGVAASPRPQPATPTAKDRTARVPQTLLERVGGGDAGAYRRLRARYVSRMRGPRPIATRYLYHGRGWGITRRARMTGDKDD